VLPQREKEWEPWHAEGGNLQLILSLKWSQPWVPSAVSRWLVFQVTMMGRSGQLDWSEEQEATLFPLNPTWIQRVDVAAESRKEGELAVG